MSQIYLSDIGIQIARVVKPISLAQIVREMPERKSAAVVEGGEKNKKKKLILKSLAFEADYKRRFEMCGEATCCTDVN